MKILMTIAAVISIWLMGHMALAQDRQPTSKGAKCTAIFEFGKISAQGETLHKARSKVSEMCMDRRLAEYTAVRGSTPEGDAADIMVLSCVNIDCI